MGQVASAMAGQSQLHRTRHPDYQKKTLQMISSVDDQAPGVHPHDEHEGENRFAFRIRR